MESTLGTPLPFAGIIYSENISCRPSPTFVNLPKYLFPCAKHCIPPGIFDNTIYEQGSKGRVSLRHALKGVACVLSNDWDTAGLMVAARGTQLYENATGE
jgi:hypothetical protein